MAKFLRKPVIVNAEQFIPDRFPWPAGVEKEMGARCSDPQCGDSTWDHNCDEGGPTGRLIIETLEGPHVVSPGDWIITGVTGDRYACKPEIFEATFERPQQLDGINKPKLSAALRDVAEQLVLRDDPSAEAGEQLVGRISAGHVAMHEYPAA